MTNRAPLVILATLATLATLAVVVLCVALLTNPDVRKTHVCVMSQAYVDALYRVLADVDRVFVANGLEYFVTAGTLLGAQRHGGLIPWDDDADVCIFDVDGFLALRPQLEKECGLRVTKHWLFELYKVTDPGTGAFCDVYILDATDKGRVTYKRWWGVVGEFFNNGMTWTMDELRPQQPIRFGPLTLMAPNVSPDVLLEREFGSDWATRASFQAPHGGCRDHILVPKADVEERLCFVPALPTLPAM